MKYIKKNIKNAPSALTTYRTTTPNAAYSGYVDKDIITPEEHPLKKALLEEQGYLCAYCMGPISLNRNENGKPSVEVEHFISQESNRQLSLDYKNLLGVCKGRSLTHPENEEMHHCDKTKGPEGKMSGKVKLRKLDPRKPECEKLVIYNANGEIKAHHEDPNIEHDLNKVLNLNNRALVQARKVILDNAKKKLESEKPNSQWNKVFLEKHLNEWQTSTDGRYRSYCMIAVWFLETLLSKPHYNQ
jgi:uncharacterized protein (TIGR02646 family)